MFLNGRELTITAEEFAKWIIWFQQKLHRKGEPQEIISKVGEILIDFNSSLEWYNLYQDQLAAFCNECQGQGTKFVLIQKSGKPAKCPKCKGEGLVKNIDQ